MKVLKKPNNQFRNRKNQSGLAMIETLPILVIFIMLFGYALGFFGVVHSGILNSISARAYAFETFRNRANLEYFRDVETPLGQDLYTNVGNRTHAITGENTEGLDIRATGRPLAIGRELAGSNANQNDHNDGIFTIRGRNREGGVAVNPAWVMVGYGICINAGCGDDGN